MTTENKPPRLVGFCGENKEVSKKVAAIMATWEQHPPERAIPVPFSGFLSVMNVLQEAVAAIVIDKRDGLDEIRIAQTLLQSIFLKELAKDNAEAAKAYDMLRSSLPKPD